MENDPLHIATNLRWSKVRQFVQTLFDLETEAIVDDELVKAVEAVLSVSPKYHAGLFAGLTTAVLEEEARIKVDVVSDK